MQRQIMSLGAVGVLALALGARVGATGQAGPDPDPLSLKVPSYHIENASITEALQKLKASATGGTLVLTLEVAPFQSEPEKNLALSVKDSTVKGVLDRIAASDPRYTYYEFGGGLVHVLPVDADADPQDLLNTEVKMFTASGIPYDRLLQYPDHYIPELGAELARRRTAGGVTGSMLFSSGVASVTVKVTYGTVRSCLNQVSLEAAKVSKSEPVPKGWVYTFRIDKSDPLGGHPRWGLL